MDISILCKSYFKGINELYHHRNYSVREKALAVLKVASLATLIIPLIVAAAWLVDASLKGRVKKDLSSTTTEKIKDLPNHPLMGVEVAKKLPQKDTIVETPPPVEETKEPQTILQEVKVVEEIKDPEIPQLPPEEVKEVSQGLPLEEKVVIETMTRDDVYKNIAVGLDKWKGFGLKVDPSDIQKAKKALPEDIVASLHLSDPEDLSKKVLDTHMLVCVPGGVSSKELGLFMKKFFPENKDGYSNFSHWVDELLGDDSTKEFRWVLMRKDPFFATRDKNYEIQNTIMEGFSKKSSLSYQVPSVLDAAACSFAYYLQFDKTYRHSDGYFIYCQEERDDSGWKAVMGLRDDGLSIELLPKQGIGLGIAPLVEL